MGFEVGSSLAELAERLGGLEAAVVLETSGIEVATWGDQAFDVLAAEIAELWRLAGAAEALAGGAASSVEIGRDGATWLVLPLGPDYLLGLHASRRLPVGKARFYAAEWAATHREEFA